MNKNGMSYTNFGLHLLKYLPKKKKKHVSLFVKTALLYIY